MAERLFILAWLVLVPALGRADIYLLWLDRPTGRDNPNDPKAWNYRHRYPHPAPTDTPWFNPLPSFTSTRTPVSTLTATLAGTGTPTPAASSTATRTPAPPASWTPTPAATASSTATLANTATVTLTLAITPSPANTGTATPAFSATASPLQSATPSPAGTASLTPYYSGTFTPVVTPTPVNTGTATPAFSATASPLQSATPSPAGTASPTPNYSGTFTPVVTPTPVNTGTATPAFSATASPLQSATSSPVVTASLTPYYSGTFTPVVTPTPVNTGTATPANSSTATPVNSSTATPVATATATPAATGTATPSATPPNTASATSTRTATSTASPVSSATSTFTPSSTATRSATPSVTPTGTSTRTATATSTNSPVNSATSTSTSSSTATRSATPSVTTTATSSRTITGTSTETPVNTGTSTSTRTATATSTQSPVNTATSTSTRTATGTSTQTPVSTGTSTSTRTATATSTQTPLNTATSTSTRTATATSTASPANTSTSTSTATPSRTASPTSTRTATPSSTASPANTATSSATPSRTASPTYTRTVTATSSATPANSSTSTATPSRTASPTATRTASATSSATPASTSTSTATPSRTASPTATRTATPSSSATRTGTPSSTRTPTPFAGLLAPCGSAFAINGQLTESSWTTGTWRNMANVTAGTLGMSATGQFQTYWDNSNLYIGLRMTKSPATLYTGTAGALWSSDSFELYFDMANNGAATYDANDFHYTLGYGVATPDISAGTSLVGVSYAWFNTGTGWSAEISIPWTSLGVAPSAGAVYGFDAAVNVASAVGTRQCQLTWNSTTPDNFQNTSAFGDLTLGAACPPMSPTSTRTPGGSTPTYTPTLTPTPVTRGATLPYQEYEAENGSLAGGASIIGPSRTVGQAANEASGRRAVQLTATNHSVAVNPTQGFNAIVVRFSIPDAAGGGGINSTISLYIGGTFVQKLNLTSKYAYAYGGWTIPYNQNPSGGTPVHHFDEVRALLPSSYAAGTQVRLQRDATDTAAFYLIDLIDLEQVGAAIPAPANSLSAASYGAVPNDAGDDTTALQNLINAAQSQGRIAYIPEGTYQISNFLTVPAISIQGAGMWRTTIHQNTDISGFRINAGSGSFFIGDLALNGEVTNRVDSATDNGLDYHGGNGSQLARVWIEHFKCAWWVGNSGTTTNNLTITGCRFRNLYADAVNFCNGTSNSTVTNTHCRGTGDDALASWSPSANPANTNNRFTFNTIQLPWRANCIAVYGGNNNRIEDNIVSDTSNYPGIMVAQEFSSTAMSGTQNVHRNTILRCGGPYGGTNHGAFKISTAQGAVNGVNASNLDILDSTYAGVFVAGGSAANGTFNTINITTAGGWGLQSTTGSGTIQCTNVVVSGAASGGMTSSGLNFQKISGNVGW